MFKYLSGSVLAYDTLNALINLDNVSTPENRRDVIGRTRALITFGSSLDKTAFIFGMQARTDQEWIREQLAASVQPLLVSYDDYRPSSFDWVNIWSKMDIISGELNYYDDPARAFNAAPCVQNKPDPDARTPLKAHVEYWNNRLLRQELYRFVTWVAAPCAQLLAMLTGNYRKALARYWVRLIQSLPSAGTGFRFRSCAALV
jgi:hypothetical protein